MPLAHMLCVVMVMQRTVSRVLSLSRGQCPLHTSCDCGDDDAMNCFQGTEFEQGVVYLVRALCDLECPEAVLGVYNWCRQIAGKKFAWVKAAAEKASKR